MKAPPNSMLVLGDGDVAADENGVASCIDVVSVVSTATNVDVASDIITEGNGTIDDVDDLNGGNADTCSSDVLTAEDVNTTEEGSGNVPNMLVLVGRATLVKAGSTKDSVTDDDARDICDTTSGAGVDATGAAEGEEEKSGRARKSVDVIVRVATGPSLGDGG